jgi:mitotic spindle assembly checkpoint protein MAD2
LRNVQKQVTDWLLSGDIQRLVVVVKGIDTMETLERWQFNVTVEDDNIATENQAPNQGSKPTNTADTKKSLKAIHNEIQAIIRQITASVTFLPLLQEPCTFDLLVYTDKNIVAPEKWADSDPCYILNSAEVKLRSFTTSVHKIDSMVAYKEADEWEL